MFCHLMSSAALQIAALALSQQRHSTARRFVSCKPAFAACAPTPDGPHTLLYRAPKLATWTDRPTVSQCSLIVEQYVDCNKTR